MLLSISMTSLISYLRHLGGPVTWTNLYVKAYSLFSNKIFIILA